MIFEKSGGAVDWLIVGLGNPGQKYEHTRHNMGFLTVDLLAEQLNVKLNKVKFKSAYNIVRFGGQKCLVMKPQTYMNLSGEAVHEAVQFYKIPADHVLVIYDDVSLPVGKLRVRPTGSAGGHNGIKNIIAHLVAPEHMHTAVLVAVCSLLPLVFAIRGIGTFFNVYWISIVSMKVLEEIRLDAFSKLQTLPLSFIDRQKRGDLISRLINDAANVQGGLVIAANDILSLIHI